MTIATPQMRMLAQLAAMLGFDDEQDEPEADEEERDQ